MSEDFTAERETMVEQQLAGRGQGVGAGAHRAPGVGLSLNRMPDWHRQVPATRAQVHKVLGAMGGHCLGNAPHCPGNAVWKKL